MKQKGISKIGIWTAILSFAIGTILFLMYVFSDAIIILPIALYFILLAGLLNLIVLFKLIAKSTSESGNKNTYLRTSLKMLINIPVVILYFYFVTVLQNTMRIEFINDTGKPISGIKIMGCELKEIDELGINESETSWIGIIGDCSLRIEYEIDGKIKSEHVFGYLTESMGHKTSYSIREKSKAIDENY